MNMTATWEPVESKHINKHQHIRITGWLHSELVNLPAEDPWHSWNMPKKASVTEVVAVAYW